MRARVLITLVVFPFLAGWGEHAPSWPQTGPLPDDPRAGAPLHYQTITAGTESYRPVEPLPWGDINRRIMPPGSTQPDGKPRQPLQNDPSAPQRMPQHKH